ncbi:MAG TPA: AAA family ATPase [Streptosporangiaceae bacterium]|jgi:energy-coupling factor transporter ATP-binding protein EcfA2
MYVSKLKIDGIRGFGARRSVNLDFTRPDGSYAGWTVLAGRNGSGKTTMLQAIALALAGENFIRDPNVWPGSLPTGRASIAITIVQDSRYDGGLDFGPLDIKVEWDEKRQANHPTWLDASVRREGDGWFYAGYGPFRRLSATALGRSEHRQSQRYAGLRTLFDEDISLVEGVAWLIEQHLYRLESRPGAQKMLDAALGIIGDGMLPDGYRISGDVDSDGLWVIRNDDRFALRQMSDGYRTVTALVVDIIRQMSSAFGALKLTHENGRPTLAYPGVVLIDEVDAHLHVSWQKTIGDWMKEHFPLVQFIVTTHSPYVCQSADPGGLIRLAAPGEDDHPRVVDHDLYQRVVYGSGDDAILTDLFGVETPYSTQAELLRRQLVMLERRVLRGDASPGEIAEYERLSETLTSSLTARVDEVASRLGRNA